MSARIDAYVRVSPVTVRNDPAQGAASTQGAAPARRAAEESAGSARGQGADRVSVSDEARRLAGQSGVASEERVARLREAIHSGSFEVDAHAIASRIVHGD